MNIVKKISTLILIITITGLISCNKDEVQITTPDIKLLTGKIYQEIGKSFVTVNGVEKSVVEFEIATENNINLMTFILSDEDLVFVSFEGEELNWETVIAVLDGVAYTGENFEATEVSSTSVSGTGIVTDDDSNTTPLTILFDITSFGAGSSTVTVEGDIAKINGLLGSLTYNQILDLNADHRNVHTILFEAVEGSVNDEINVETGRLIREAGYSTELKSTSEIYSGGVDLFCSGVKRTIAQGATVGVHSWCCGSQGEGAADIPVGDSQHNSQISYFNEMLGDPNGENFYFFTINAAAFEDVHEMSEAEITQYMLRSE